MTESYHLGYELAETKFKRPQGKWVFIDGEWVDWKCSNCGFESVNSYKYCPNCGAEMREDRK